MLKKIEFRRYCTLEHQLSKAAVSYIEMVRENPPSRMVGTHARRNIVSFYPSKKMGHTISTESRGPEKSFAIFCEYDERVIEFWEQPEPIKVERYDKNGKSRAGSYTPDFLVLTSQGPRVIEVKPQKILDNLIKVDSKNWETGSENLYTYLPAQKAFEDIGLKHEVFAFDDSMRFKVFNLELMLSARESSRVITDAIQNDLENAYEESFSWTMSDLKDRLNLNSYTDLIHLIDKNALFFDLDNKLLSEPDGVTLVRFKDHLSLIDDIDCNNKIYNGDLEEPISVSRQPGLREVEKVLARLARLDSGEQSRSARRWAEKLKNSEGAGLSRFQILISNKHQSGNKQRKIPYNVQRYLKEFLVNIFAPSAGLSIYRGYIKYKHHAPKEHPGYDAVTRKTFTRYLKGLPLGFLAGQRQGKRGANAAEASSDPLSRALKAQLPWQSAAIDHYKADIYLIVSSHDGQIYVERPWVTAMIDLSSGIVLALTLSFKDPSRNSCAKVIRECVRSHQQLPREIIVDRGSDFRSVYFAALLAHYGITLSLRPSAHSRYGGEVESLFGEFKKIWLSQRPGNLADYKEARSVDGTHAPKKSAILRAGDLFDELNRFCEWRNSKPINIHIESGFDMFSRRLKEFPCLAVGVEFDHEFLLSTAVETKKYDVDPQRGIKINELWYFSPAISGLKVIKSKAEVRVDPENPHVIYALISDKWESLYSSQINSFAAKTSRKQFEEGLVALEGANLRRRIRENKDIELVGILQEMDALVSAETLPIVHINASSMPANAINFDEMDLSDLKVEAW
tara:strand:- start:5245 stop:7626 length:2382 start_codon:yes stop_codon:yes gene_type:complete